MRHLCHIKISQTQGVLNAWPFCFSGLKIDENNWLFVFAAILQVIGAVSTVSFVGGGERGTHACAKKNRKASSVIFAGSLVLPKSVLVRPVVSHAECPLFPQFSVDSTPRRKARACAHTHTHTQHSILKPCD